MRNVAIIPARGGSKRLPGKNTRLLGGLPLVVHSIKYAQANGFKDAVYVSTDDEEIAQIARQYGAEVIDRPSGISGDQATTASVLKHAVEQLGNVANVVLLQPTNPLRPENLLREALDIYRQNNCTSLFTVTRNSHKLGRIDANRFVPFNYVPGQRSQDLEPLYFENGLLYIASADLIHNEIIIAEDAFPMVVAHPYASVDIDTKQDFDYATFLMNYE